MDKQTGTEGQGSVNTNVQIGCCCKIEESELAYEAGFDYLECPVVSLLPEEDDAAFEEVLARFREASLPTRAFNIFLPGDLKVVGPDVDGARVARYVRRALARVRTVGADVVVFGSGRARNVPEDFSVATALEQLTDFLQMAGEIAQEHALVLVIEPLNRRESNVINSVAEAGKLAGRVNRPAVRVLADLYHMQEEHEPLDAPRQWADRLAHIHVADSERGAPGTGSYPYAEFFGQLQAAGYGADRAPLISIECRWQQFAQEAPIAVETLRTHWRAVANAAQT